MKAVSESTWTFQMIIFFMLIFACFLTLVLSYNKAYIIKNRMLSIVEKYEGITSESLKIINGSNVGAAGQVSANHQLPPGTGKAGNSFNDQTLLAVLQFLDSSDLL